MARPKSPDHERKDATPVGVRLSAVQRAELEHKADALGLGLSEFFRRRALGYRLPQIVAERQQAAEATTALLRLGVNLNQIAKHVNAGRDVPVAELSDLIQRVNHAMDQLDEPR